MKRYFLYISFLISSFFMISNVNASVELYNGDIVSDFPSACANTKNIVTQNSSLTQYSLICINNNNIGDYILTRLGDMYYNSYLFNIDFNTNTGTITSNTIGVQTIYRLYKNNLSGSWSYVGRNNEYGFRAQWGPEYYEYYNGNGVYTSALNDYRFAQYSNIDLYTCPSGVSSCTPTLIYKVDTVDYDIQFSVINSSDDSQELYGDDSHITGAGIAINYFPKDYSLYNYYYYWEVDENGSSSGPPSNYSDWEQLTTSDRGIGAISVHENGWLYAHITDKNGNLLYSSSYDWHMIGSLSLIPVNNNKISTFLSKISDNINYGGPISGIITIPINFISAIYNSFIGSCRNFNLGALLGTNIVFTCFTLESILGSSITNTIDILCSFYIYYNLILFIISVYRKVVSLDDLDDYIPKHSDQSKHDDYNS